MALSKINRDRLAHTTLYSKQQNSSPSHTQESLRESSQVRNPATSAATLELRDVPANELIQEVDFRKLSSRLATMSYEILLGLRPLQQLANWVSPDVISQLDHRLSVASDSLPGAQVATRETVRILNTHVCEISPRVIESCVTLRVGKRVHACAMRFEIFRNRWRATAIILG